MGDLINFIFDQFLDLVCFPLLGGGPYLRGFLVGTLSALVVGWSARFILFHRGRMQYFFDTVQPSLRPSPGGYDRMRGCSCSGMLLVIFAGTILIIGFGIIYALSH